MGRPRKTVKTARTKKSKSALPDIVSGKYVIVKTDGGEESLLMSTARGWARGEAVTPYIFPTQMHASAYLDGMSDALKEGGQNSVEKLSKFFEQSFSLEYLNGGSLNVFTTLVPRGSGTTFKAAVRQLETEVLTEPLQSRRLQIKELETDHKKEMAAREKAHRERVKAMTVDLKALEKEQKAFHASVKKLGG